MGQIFNGLKPGQKLANASEYIKRLVLLDALASKDFAALSRKGLPASPALDNARAALQTNRDLLDKVTALARVKGIIPTIHEAVRSHDAGLAGLIRAQDRRLRLGKLLELYTEKSQGNKPIAALLAKPGFMLKLRDALELYHACNDLDPKSPAFKQRFTDPSLLKIFADPVFVELVGHPEAQMILNGQDVATDVDALGISPLDEAILQKDEAMIERLRFAHHGAHLKSGQMFKARIHKLKDEIAVRRQIDVGSLDPISKAAYLGDMALLEMETDFNSKDKKGLTPLHYAILGGHTDAIDHILPRCTSKTRYALTPDLLPGSTKQLSCLDYAIIAGHPEAFAYFQNLKLPFKLGRKEELYSYLEASGLFRTYLERGAKAKDPLQTSPLALISSGVNGAWTALSLLSHCLGNPTNASDWLGWSVDKARNGTVGANEFVGLGQIFQALPPGISQTVWLYRNAMFLFGMVQLGAWAVGLDSYLPKQFGLLHFIDSKITPINEYYPNVGYAALRVYAVAKPALDKLPLYRASFKSRPTAVMKSAALDLFQIATQAAISYCGIPGPKTATP